MAWHENQIHQPVLGNRKNHSYLSYKSRDNTEQATLVKVRAYRSASKGTSTKLRSAFRVYPNDRVSAKQL